MGESKPHYYPDISPVVCFVGWGVKWLWCKCVNILIVSSEHLKVGIKGNYHYLSITRVTDRY